MKDIMNIQSKIYKYKDNYVIYDYDLESIFNIPIKDIIKKYRKLFLKDYMYKINNNYIFTEKGIITISLILGENYDDKVISILKVTEYLKRINSLDKIKNSF